MPSQYPTIMLPPLKGLNKRDSAGFIKIYIGITPYYIPVFTAIIA